MSHFEWEDIDINAGNMVHGIISNIDYKNLTADVEGVGIGIPIHYHCEEDAIEDTGKSYEVDYPDEQDERGATAFIENDSVLVMFRRINNKDPVIIGFPGEARQCAFNISVKVYDYEEVIVTDERTFSISLYNSEEVSVGGFGVYDSETESWIIEILEEDLDENGYWISMNLSESYYIGTQYPLRVVNADKFNLEDLVLAGSSVTARVGYFRYQAGGNDGGSDFSPVAPPCYPATGWSSVGLARGQWHPYTCGVNNARYYGYNGALRYSNYTIYSNLNKWRVLKKIGPNSVCANAPFLDKAGAQYYYDYESYPWVADTDPPDAPSMGFSVGAQNVNADDGTSSYYSLEYLVFIGDRVSSISPTFVYGSGDGVVTSSTVVCDCPDSFVDPRWSYVTYTLCKAGIYVYAASLDYPEWDY